METPFTYGRIAMDTNFTDRDSETKHLTTNFVSGINTILISPRRWGKSSLVNRAAAEVMATENKIRFCFLDLYNVRSEVDFYELLSKEVLKASCSKMDEIGELVKKYLGKLLPKITYSPDSNSEFAISFDWKETDINPDYILNLAENICKEKKIKLVICIDEFQNISTFGDSLVIQKKLRSYWQKHQLTTYCLYGSKRHMMMDVFTSSDMPFYKFGDILFLQKIETQNLVRFIMKRFADTGKTISEEDAALVIDYAENHPYYVQQIAQLVWLRTPRKCKTKLIKEAVDSLVLQLDFLFQTITDGLSNSQIKFLEALLSGETKLSSTEVINKYQLGTSGNVTKVRKALENKEIIDLFGDSITLLDPIYKKWLCEKYFKIGY